MRTVLAAYGRTVAVHLPTELVEPVLQRLPPTYARSTGGAERMWAATEHRGQWTGQVDGEALLDAADPMLVAEGLLSDLELWVAEHAVDRVFLHAGCVALDGRAIVIPGRTMSGKTSLTAALVRAGAAYCSDEYAVLDARGLVHPYARPLSVRPYDGAPPRRVPVADLGGETATEPLPIGLVAHLRYEPGFCEQRDVTAGEATLLLVDNCVSVRRQPAEALDAITAAVRSARAVAGTRGDADEAAASLLALLES